MILKDDNNTVKVYAKSIEKHYQVSKLKNTKGKVCLDLGAHVGTFALKVAELTKCLVHSYEPYPANFRILSYHVKVNQLWGRIAGFEEALWGDEGTHHISVDPKNYSEAHTIYKMNGWNRTKINTTTAEKVFSRIHSPIAYLKANCQGGEYYLLKYLMEHKEILNSIERMAIQIHPDMIGKDKMDEVITALDYILCNYKKPFKINFASLFRTITSDKIVNKYTINKL